MAQDNLHKWQQLLANLVINLKCYPHLIFIKSDVFSTVTASEINEIELKTKIVLPQGYKEFCQVFGNGGFGIDGLLIECPNIQNFKAHFNSNLAIRENIIDGYGYGDFWSQTEKEILENAYLFGSGSNYVDLLFDLRSYDNKDESYDIYGVAGAHGGFYYLGRDFFEFVRNVCIGDEAVDKFPLLFQSYQDPEDIEDLEDEDKEEILDRTERKVFYPFPEAETEQDIIPDADITTEEIHDSIEKLKNYTASGYKINFFLKRLRISNTQIVRLPENIGNLNDLEVLDLPDNKLISLPENIINLIALKILDLSGNKFTNFPKKIGNFTNLEELYLSDNNFIDFSESIGNLINLEVLDLSNNKLTSLPENIKNLTNLYQLNLANNQISELSDRLVNLVNLRNLNLTGNPLTDLSILQNLPALEYVTFFGMTLPRKYWTDLSEWKAEWLLDEDYTLARQILIRQIGYKRICEELGAIEIERWEKYTLLLIESKVDRKLIALVKIIYPPTENIEGSIDLIRLPSKIKNLKEAIVWLRG